MKISFLYGMILMMLVCGVLFGSFAYFNTGSGRKFDMVLWRVAPEQGCVRASMLNDLLKNRLTPNLFYSKVTDMLGTPQNKVGDCDEYDLGFCSEHPQVLYVLKICYTGNRQWLKDADYFTLDPQSYKARIDARKIPFKELDKKTKDTTKQPNSR